MNIKQVFNSFCSYSIQIKDSVVSFAKRILSALEQTVNSVAQRVFARQNQAPSGSNPSTLHPALTVTRTNHPVAAPTPAPVTAPALNLEGQIHAEEEEEVTFSGSQAAPAPAPAPAPVEQPFEGRLNRAEKKTASAAAAFAAGNWPGAKPVPQKVLQGAWARK